MQNGVYIKNISLPNLQVKKLYIKWNEKLNISVQEANIIKNSDNKNSKIDVQQVDKLFKFFLLFDNWFEKIEINKIIFNDIKGSFKYVEGQNGFLIASSKNFSLKSSLFFESHFLNAKVEEFHDYKRNIKINGNIIFDSYYNLEFISALNININNDIKLKAYILANKEKLYYKIDSKNKIKNIKHTVDMLNVPSAVTYWIYDAIKASDIDLKSAYGWLQYNKVQDAYKNIYVSANINNLNYIYNPELEPVISKYTEIEYKNGILFIRPKEAFQYGFFLDKSWIKIDFTKKEELLTLFLLFNGKVNSDLLHLLNTYKIKLPFLQNSGNVDTNLKIEVGLRNIDVVAKGDFYTEKSNFTYLGLDIDIFKAHIFLDNYDVSIKNMYSKYKDIASADVDVKFNAKTNEGKIDFHVKDVNFKEIGLNLKKTTTPLEINYTISNNKDTIEAKSSTWEFKGKDIDIEGLSLPFDLKKLVATIPTTAIKINNLALAYTSGTFSLKPLTANLNVDLLKFTLENVKMNQSNASLKVKYDKKIFISLDDKVRFSANGLDYILSNSLVEIDEDLLRILAGTIKIEDLADAKLNADYSFKTNSGTINLKTLEFRNKDLGQMFSSADKIQLEINSNKGITKVIAKDFDAAYTLLDNGWKIKFKSLENLSKKSKLLQDYNITNGDFIIYKKNNEKNIKFIANTKYPYKFLTSGNKLIEDYLVKGEIEKNTNDLSLNINDSIDIKVGDSIKVTAKKVGININEILNYFDDINSTSKSTKSVVLDTTDSYLYITKDRYIISDTMHLQYFNKILSAQLKHKKGTAGFELKDGKFYLYGDDFNDKFMDKLFALSKFKDGKLSFSMSGTTKEYDGLLHIKNTTVLDYKILNNILAFVNTIPSLITFSVPGYSTNGLEVSSAYVNFHAKNNIFNIKDLSLDSKEIDILGRGTANYKNNTIDLKLNLKTDLGSMVSKIPIVGYILLGEDTISTTMKISGKLDDPNVESLIATDIAVAPFNIIKRTLLLPFHLFGSDEKEEEEKKE
ncbi:MAG: hypothetical protein ACJAWW_000172 [Sulfurimonas sp.]